MKNHLKIVFITFFTIILSGAQCQQISQWRGVNRDGIYQDKQLLSSWPENGPALLWSTEEIGNGYGSPVILDGKIYVNGEIDSTSHLFVFDLNGKLLWKSPFGKEFTGQGFSSNFPGNRSTPTVVGSKVYVTSGTGRISCFDAGNGKEIWTRSMVNDLQGMANEFGYAESLLTYGDLLFCYPGGKECNVAALDRNTGKTVWISGAAGDTVSFCSPVLVKLPHRDLLVTFSIKTIFALDAKTGDLLWTHTQDSVRFGVQGNTPVYSDGFLCYGAGDGNGAVKLKLSPDGSTFEEIWRNKAMTNDMGGFIIVNDKLYGTAANKKMLVLDTHTGTLTDSMRVGSGSIIFADGKLFCHTDKNEMHLLSISGTSLTKVSSFKCKQGTKEALAHPAIGDGMLLVRHGKLLMAYKIR